MSKQLEFEYQDNKSYMKSKRMVTQEQIDRAEEDYKQMMASSRADIVPHLNQDYSYVLLSGGKDSVTLVHRLITEGYNINAVCYIDTRCEFPVMHRNAMRCLSWVEEWNVEHGTDISTFILKPALNFWEAFESGHRRDKYKSNSVVPSKRFVCRRLLRIDVVDEFHRNLKDRGYNKIIQYTGRNASDNTRGKPFVKTFSAFARDIKVINLLYDQGWTNQQTLKYVTDLGYDYENFYSDFNHGYCIACPHRPLNEWRKIWANYPDIWDFLRKKLSIAPNLTCCGEYTFFDLEKRFQYEVEYAKKHPGSYKYFLTKTGKSQSSGVPAEFYIGLYLMLGASNPAFQKKADEQLGVVSVDASEVNFFLSEEKEYLIPICVYNIFDGKERFYMDYHEFANDINMPPSVVREYAERGMFQECSNKEKLLNYQWLVRYTFGKEHAVIDGCSIPSIALYGWNMEEHISDEAQAKLDKAKMAYDEDMKPDDVFDRFEPVRQLEDMRTELIEEGLFTDQEKIETMKDLFADDVTLMLNGNSQDKRYADGKNIENDRSRYTKDELHDKVEKYKTSITADIRNFQDDTGLYDL